MADLFGLEGPFGGCRRRLWYDKSGIPQDSPAPPADVMLRGKMLEDAAAEQYALDTGRKIRRTRTARVHPSHPWARVNVDRVINPVKEHEGTGTLEIKTQNAWMFRTTKREGLSDGYILQNQHAMLVTGSSWGAFMVLQPDSWARLKFDVERNEELQQAIIRKGDEFWPLVGGGPAPPQLEADDVRCTGCPWRRTCQGFQRLAEAAGLSVGEMREPLPRDEAFAEILEDYVEVQARVKELEGLRDRIQGAIKAQLGDRQAVECSKGRIYFRPQASTRLDAKALKEALPDVYTAYARPVETRPLRVYKLEGRGDGD